MRSYAYQVYVQKVIIILPEDIAEKQYPPGAWNRAAAKCGLVVTLFKTVKF